ncbi:MAG TPA: complex I subunit 1 family protein [Polyangia bacterium]|nr:complex I subunit 1 family protein [Polyangia bacterium]
MSTFDYGGTGFQAIEAIVKILFMVLGFLMPLASILTWLERRQSAMMQDRLGPKRAFIPLPRGKRLYLWGILHFVADALKFIKKEDYVPSKAHKFLFMWAPIMSMAPALIVAAIIPFGAPLCWGESQQVVGYDNACSHPVGLQIARLDIGLLFYFAISSLSVYGATLAGWASHNKWAMMGGLRASSQMMSYEVTMGMAVLGAFLVYGTLEPGAIVEQQSHILSFSNWGSSWGIFMQPLGFILFLTAAIAETKRTPFDIPEGEPEIIGYFVEYSGMRFGLFFLGEFLEIVTSSAIMVSLFFGGWHWGKAIDSFLAEFFTAHIPNINLYFFVITKGFLFSLFTIFLWSIKIFVFCMFQLLIRWSLPRFRSDQLLRLGWQRLLPISIANVVVTAIVILVAQSWSR